MRRYSKRYQKIREDRLGLVISTRTIENVRELLFKADTLLERETNSVRDLAKESESYEEYLYDLNEVWGRIHDILDITYDIVKTDY